MAEPMLKLCAEEIQQQLLKSGFNHLKVATRGNSISVFSEFEGKRENRCRFTKLNGATYELSMADHTGRWEETPFTGSPKELLDIAIDGFGWVLCNYDEFQ